MDEVSATGEVAVIGLGGMGRAIARNLVRAGHRTVVWNRSAGPAEELARDGAHRAASVSEALRCPVVFSVLSDDAAFTETFLDSGVLARARPGTVHVNVATVSVELCRRAAEAHAGHGIGYVAAPVFGRVSVAEAGALNVLAAGRPELLDLVQPFLDVIGSRTWRLGERPEQAGTAKVLGNYLIACAIQSLGEAVSVAEAAGTDPEQFVELLASTLFPGPVYAGYGSMIARRTYRPAGFTALLGRKDLRLALDAAADRSVPLPFGDLLADVFDRTIADGRAADDWAVIAERQPR
ncbi:NAD(P)-dependent oxidoreductase [Kitasatospora cineracea]|uniref:NAD(P)-dependent oxidoreductase n=1 Tax=Kitasatospora cineracea TaxID=88074 RepID=UPI003416D17E